MGRLNEEAPSNLAVELFQYGRGARTRQCFLSQTLIQLIITSDVIARDSYLSEDEIIYA